MTESPAGSPSPASGWPRVGGLEEVREEAVKVAEDELLDLLRSRAFTPEVTYRRYRALLSCIARGSDSWGKVMSCLGQELGSTVSSSVLDNMLRTLERLSIVKDYTFLDNVYREAALRLR